MNMTLEKEIFMNLHEVNKFEDGSFHLPLCAFTLACLASTSSLTRAVQAHPQLRAPATLQSESLPAQQRSLAAEALVSGPLTRFWTWTSVISRFWDTVSSLSVCGRK
jgi:hypothetical protein